MPLCLLIRLLNGENICWQSPKTDDLYFLSCYNYIDYANTCLLVKEARPPSLPSTQYIVGPPVLVNWQLTAFCSTAGMLLIIIRKTNSTRIILCALIALLRHFANRFWSISLITPCHLQIDYPVSVPTAVLADELAKLFIHIIDQYHTANYDHKIKIVQKWQKAQLL